MQFTKLRLEGFKSFVDPTELIIRPGLTGVVGPNGCGKSNLLEALRWVMGETRAKQMRGGGMEDVIFAGSAARPARARASVSLTIDNTAGRAPERWREAETLEIVRRIQRDTGSDYRLNGKAVRARDVGTMLADAATGATSPALVRQGQIAELIEAKPQARRRILEDAAGISGLYQRRHESLGKLKAAEANLERLDDVLEQLAKSEAQLERQSGAARRYRELAAGLRAAEARLVVTRHRLAAAALAEAERLGRDGLVALSRAEAAAREAEGAREAAETAIPAVREEEAIATAIAQRLAQEQAVLEERAREAADRLSGLQAAARRVEEDRTRERQLAADAAGALERLAEEARRLEQAGQGAEARLTAARDAADGAHAAEKAADSRVDEAAATLASLRAEMESVTRRLQDAERSAAAAETEARRLDAARQAAEAQRAEARAAASAASGANHTAEADRLHRVERAAEAESARDRAAGAADAARTALVAAERAEATVEAERKGVERLVAQTAGKGDRVLDLISVAPGYEAAFGAAFGDDCDLPLLDGGADASGWLSDGASADAVGSVMAGIAATPLTEYVEAPAALARRLAHVGVVDAAPDSAALAALPAGVRLVSLVGDLWRWDGLVCRAGDAPSAAAQRLSHLNRLKALEAEVEEARTKTTGFRAEADRLKAVAAEARESAAKAAQVARTATDTAAAAARDKARGEAQLAEAEARAAATSEAVMAHGEVIDSVQRALREARSAANAAADPTGAEEALGAAREAVATARKTAREAQQRLADEERAVRGRERRLREVETEARDWHRRAATTAERDATLVKRAAETAQALALAESAPAEIATARGQLAEKRAGADRRLKAAADALAAAETALSDAARTAREAERNASTLRETRAKHEARIEAASEAAAEAEAALTELDAEVRVTAEGAVDGQPAVGEVRALEGEIQRLTRARDALGAVNLRADEDAKELRSEREALEVEKADLDGAIAKLRSGVASLNREGRARLTAAFDAVNREFSALFRRLFGGGEARLVMVENDDPLEAGLEILCQPPGKKLSSLSLLSGGEQTLTALSLILAVFLCQPSPICVLDEVDAPLDDANTDRFCSLLDEMRGRTETRFLVITHHPLTMARMDRLFGVTMVEQGVSQLVSVDLEAAEQLVDA
ncbi:MAG: chromosome segregation protein SMC [Pseudomonadota bacterium]